MALQEEPDDGGIPEWVVTFGDMMSLLLTFFIMLVSMSEIKEEERYQALVESMRKQFGHSAATVSMTPGRSKPRNSKLAKLATMGRARRFDIRKGGNKAKAPVGDNPAVRIIRPGTQTAVGSVYTFDEGSVELTAAQKQDLQVQVQQIGGKPQKIEVRGHTSQRPVSPRDGCQDNWDLAYQRSRAMLKELVALGVDPKRIRLSVAGPHEPVHLSTDPIKMRQNPRVEVFLLDEVAEELEGTAEEKEQRFTDKAQTK